jgi:guanylate kinase
MKQRAPQLAKRQGIIFILSAPSGAGKTTLYNGLKKNYPDIQLSVSCTTRAQRPGEMPGRDYRFLSEARFEALKSRGEFAEWAQVHDYRYGTPRKPIDRAIKAGRDILLDIDVQGARKIKRAYPAAVAVFVLPPSWAELARRLSMRGTDDRRAIERRLANARGEIAQRIHYDYFVVNHDVDQAVRLLSGIVEAERCKVSRVIEWRVKPLRAKRRQSNHEQRNQTARSG